MPRGNFTSKKHIIKNEINNFVRNYKRIVTLALLAVFAITGYVGYLLFNRITKEKENTSIDELNNYIFLCIAAYLLFAIIMSFLAITHLNLYTEELQTRKKPCKYCGNDFAGPILCNSCKSIMWYNLRKRNILLPFVIFVLEHRWSFLVAMLAVFLSPVPTILGIIKEKESYKTGLRIEIKKEIDNINKARHLLSTLEMESNTNKVDYAKLSEMSEHYLNSTWSVPGYVVQMLQFLKLNNKIWQGAIDTASLHKNCIWNFESKDPTYPLKLTAWLILTDKVDLTFNAERDHYLKTYNQAKTKNQTKLINARKRAAFDFERKLKLTNIVLFFLYNGETLTGNTNFQVDEGLTGYYKAYLKNEEFVLKTDSISSPFFNLLPETHHRKHKKRSGA